MMKIHQLLVEVCIIYFMVFIETVFAAALNMQMADWLSYICSQLYYIWFQMWYMHHVIIQPCQTCHNNSLNHSTITMKALSVAQHNHILSLLDSGHSGHEISSQTGVSNATISRLYSRHHPYHKKLLVVVLLSSLNRIYTMLLS